MKDFFADADAAVIAIAAAKRLLACQLTNGAVIYEVDANTGQYHNRLYSMVRMAGVAYSLAWAAHTFKKYEGVGEALSNGAEKAIAFLLEASALQEKGYYVGEFSFDSGLSDVGKLGATSLLAIALMKSPAPERYSRELDRLIATILGCQAENGSFYGFVGERRMAGQRYAPGEALLALALHLEKAPSALLLNAIERGFTYYRRYFTFDPHQALRLWHADCWSRLACLDSVPDLHREMYAAFADHIVADLPARQIKQTQGNRIKGGISFDSQPGVSTALYAEALVYVAGMHKKLGGLEKAHLYRETADHALDFVKELQVQEGGFRVKGGFRSNVQSTRLRMDNDQHVITYCLALLETDCAYVEQRIVVHEQLQPELTI